MCMADRIEGAIERRFVASELRVIEGDDGQIHIRGYGAVFNSRSEDLGGFVEMIAPGAFAKTLQESDVRSLQNHDANYVIGRSGAGTLTLREDDHGLYYDAMAPDTQWARDLIVSLKRGDIDQSSFGFRTVRDDWIFDPEGNEEEVIRTLLEVELYDVGPVTFPAYPQTSSEARDRASAMATEPPAAPPEDGHPDGDGDEGGPRARVGLLRRRLDLLEAE